MTVDETIARVDHDRTRRTGLPEAVFCSGKTVEAATSIVAELLDLSTSPVIATRPTPDQRLALEGLNPAAASNTVLTWNHRAPTGHRAAVVCAGTSDLPVATEAAATLTALGHSVTTVTDVGVAGLHRLTDAIGEFATADVIVAVAGMEGSLPTVIAGLVAPPIIAVPTSVGYGSSLEGVTALLSMLASCAPGLTVVGIDNGFGAACAAHRILAGLDRP